MIDVLPATRGRNSHGGSISAMTILLVLLLLGTAASLAVLVRDIARDPARSLPCSRADEFSPRWADAGTGRWSV